jgi:hypothetical protein
MNDHELNQGDESREGAPSDDLDLTAEQADAVQGGVTIGEIHVTKPIDKPSP